MAKRSATMTTLTPTATADTTALTNATYPTAFKGGSATQRTNFLEIMLGGQATASAPTYMVFARDSTVGVGSQTQGTGGKDQPLDAATAALAAVVGVGNTFATSAPQRDTAAHLLNLSFNAFGGIVRWLAAPGEEISMVGNTASLGECTLSAFTGGTAGAMGSHVIYETL